jgi:hypothetical protein
MSGAGQSAQGYGAGGGGATCGAGGSGAPGFVQLEYGSQVSNTIAFSTTPSVMSAVNTCSGPYTLALEDLNGNPTTNTTGTTLTVSLSQSSGNVGNFYGSSDTTCSQSPITQVSFAPGASQASFYLADSTLSSPLTLTASGNGWISGVATTTTFSGTFCSTTNTTGFGNGTGSSGNPFIICTPQQLQNVGLSAYVGGSYYFQLVRHDQFFSITRFSAHWNNFETICRDF